MKVRIDAFHALAAFAFCAGVSMPLARAFLLAALVLAVADAVRGRLRWRMSGTAWGWIGYVVVAFAVTALVAATLPQDALIRPDRGLRKLDKLLWYVGVVLFPLYVTDAARFRKTLSAFALGCAVYSVGILVLHPIGALVLAHFSNPAGHGQVWTDPGGAFYAWVLHMADALGKTEALQRACRVCCAQGSFNKALASLSGMGAAQRLMVGAVVSLALACGGKTSDDALKSFSPRIRWLVACLVSLGLVMTCKRGSLFVFLLLGAVMAVRWTGWRRGALAAVAVLALAAAVPAARERIRQIPDEFRFEKGGRVLMWTDLAPAMRKKYPWGVGFRGLTYESLRYATDNGWRLEKNQNHLHNNFLQVTVELGWIGLAAYLSWMALAFRAGFQRGRRPFPNGRLEEDALLRFVPLLALAALFLNGFVEYNLADGELTILYGMAMGLAETASGKNVG